MIVLQEEHGDNNEAQSLLLFPAAVEVSFLSVGEDGVQMSGSSTRLSNIISLLFEKDCYFQPLQTH